MIKINILIKSTIYRLYSSCVTSIVAFCVTGSWSTSLTVGVADMLVKIGTYYGFDMIWAKLTKQKHRKAVVWLTGLSGAGKTTIARELERRLKNIGEPVTVLDGDELREMFGQTGFDKKSRDENVKNVGRIAAFLQRRGGIAIVSMISPYGEVRDECRKMASDFMEVYVSTPISECERRDVKGLYKKARTGEIKDFTGIHKSAPYEFPKNPELTIDTRYVSLEKAVKSIISELRVKKS
jgi:adenylyl-sulfate kinase